MFSNISRCALALTLSLLSLPAFAQEFPASHIAKAREAITATRATDSFDTILIRASGQLKNQLTANNLFSIGIYEFFILENFLN